MKEALQCPMRFPFQLFPPEPLGAEFVSWLLSSGALTCSTYWRFAHRTHSFDPVPEPTSLAGYCCPCEPLKSEPLKRFTTALGILQARSLFCLFPAVFSHVWLQPGSVMSLLPRSWPRGLEPLGTLGGGQAASCLLLQRERGSYAWGILSEESF